MEAVRAVRPGVDIETIEVLAHPARVLRERVFMIPLLEIGDKRWYQAPRLEAILAALDAEPML